MTLVFLEPLAERKFRGFAETVFDCDAGSHKRKDMADLGQLQTFLEAANCTHAFNRIFSDAVAEDKGQGGQQPAYQDYSIVAKPSSSQPGVETAPDGSLVVRLQSPPVDGKANKELIELLAKHLGRLKSELEIIRGHAGREKTVRATNIW